MAEPVRTDRREAVLVVTIQRPEARNAIDERAAQLIAAAMDELDAEPELRCGVLTGAGGTFCAGMDLKAFVAGERPYAGERGFAGICQRPPETPLIAAVEGYALAGGMEIALACDLVVAARDASFGIPEVRRGLVAAAGALIRLPKRIAYHQAMELALTGERVDAERAAALGLVNRVVDTGTALDGALALAATIVANAPLAVRTSKQIVRDSPDWTEAEAWRRSGELAAPVFTSHDAEEGARAFAEKREARWEGR